VTASSRPAFIKPMTAVLVEKLPEGSVVIDGEVVAVDAQGRPSFQALQHRSAHPDYLAFYAFDALHLDGRDLTGEPLQTRRALLPRLVARSGLLESAELRGSAEQVIAAVDSRLR